MNNDTYKNSNLVITNDKIATVNVAPTSNEYFNELIYSVPTVQY